MLFSMANRNVALDEEAYEILSGRKRQGQSFSQVIKEHFETPAGGTAADLLRNADQYVLTEETLDAIDAQAETRSRNLPRAVKL
jgi:predicted CopG family antitoxin